MRGITYDQSGIKDIWINDISTSFDSIGNFGKSVPLQQGDNIIHIVATDIHGNSTRISIKVEKKASPKLISKQVTQTSVKDLYNKSYAVVIGINKYEKWPQLEGAIADADIIAKALKDSGFDKIIMIKDEEATQRRILSVLYDEIPKQITEDDRFCILFRRSWTNS